MDNNQNFNQNRRIPPPPPPRPFVRPQQPNVNNVPLSGNTPVQPGLAQKANANIQQTQMQQNKPQLQQQRVDNVKKAVPMQKNANPLNTNAKITSKTGLLYALGVLCLLGGAVSIALMLIL